MLTLFTQKSDIPPPPEKRVTLACILFILVVSAFLGLQCVTIDYRQRGDVVEASYALVKPDPMVAGLCLFLIAFASGVPIPTGFVAGILAYVSRVGSAMSDANKSDKS